MAVKAAHEIKGLESRIATARAEYTHAAEEAKAANAKCKALQNKIDQLTAELRKYRIEPTVTEHALLRYLERFMGVNLEDVKNMMMPPETAKVVKFVVNGKVPIPGGKLVVKNMAIVTVEAAE